MGGIFLDATTRFYLNMLRSAQATMGWPQNQGSGKSFLQAIENAASNQIKTEQGVDAASGVERTYSTADMTMEEYKQYIYDKIIRMPVNYSQMHDAVSIMISEEGLAAMKADPEYEKWVLDTIRRDLAAFYPWGTMGRARTVPITLVRVRKNIEDTVMQRITRGDEWPNSIGRR